MWRRKDSLLSVECYLDWKRNFGKCFLMNSTLSMWLIYCRSCTPCSCISLLTPSVLVDWCYCCLVASDPTRETVVQWLCSIGKIEKGIDSLVVQLYRQKDLSGLLTIYIITVKNKCANKTQRDDYIKFYRFLHYISSWHR